MRHSQMSLDFSQIRAKKSVNERVFLSQDDRRTDACPRRLTPSLMHRVFYYEKEIWIIYFGLASITHAHMVCLSGTATGNDQGLSCPSTSTTTTVVHNPPQRCLTNSTRDQSLPPSPQTPNQTQETTIQTSPPSSPPSMSFPPNGYPRSTSYPPARPRFRTRLHPGFPPKS